MQDLIVTIDGPAGSGKSTVARLLAKRLGVSFLDTGAMYRGITAECIDRGIDPSRDVEAVIDLARRCTLQFDWQTDPPHLHVQLDGQDDDVTDRLREPDVAAGVSYIAAKPEVRTILVEAQRRIGQAHRRLVTEGRDQGSVVFPDADAKFFIEAATEVRAHRRAEQLRLAGQEVDEQKIHHAMVERDGRDRQRPDGPLICPNDATLIDTSDMTIEQVVDALERRVVGSRG